MWHKGKRGAEKGGKGKKGCERKSKRIIVRIKKYFRYGISFQTLLEEYLNPYNKLSGKFDETV